MNKYEILDNIADSYNPILFFAYIIFAILYFKEGDKKAVLKGFLGVVICYVILYIDNKFQIWKSIGLDYSTHSAIALALVVFHVHKRKIYEVEFIAFSISLLAYYILEVYQKYHTLEDIVSTCIVVAPLLFSIYKILEINNTSSLKS